MMQAQLISYLLIFIHAFFTNNNEVHSTPVNSNIASITCSSDPIVRAKRCYTNDVSEMAGRPSLSGSSKYVRLELENCEDAGLESVSHLECEEISRYIKLSQHNTSTIYNTYIGLQGDTSGIYNNTYLGYNFGYANIVRIESGVCDAERGYESLTKAVSRVTRIVLFSAE
jgi:hypothetical protein